jgi:hypothetical protein
MVNNAHINKNNNNTIIIILMIIVPLMVGGIPTPLKNMSSKIGMITPNLWKIKNVPNHQPD